MKAFLATNMIGTFAFDKSGELIEKRLFPKNPEKIAKKMELMEKKWLPEEQELLSILMGRKYIEVVTDRNLEFKGISIIHQEDNFGKQKLKEEFRFLAVSLKWVTSQAELNEILSKVSVAKTKEKLREERKDRVLMRVVGVVEELDSVLNNFSERLREWYGLHFPELSTQVKSHEKFAELVAKHGSRVKVKEYRELARGSAGMEFSDADLKEVKDFALSILELYQRKKALENYLEKACNGIIPNTSAVAGPVMACKMLSLAGGLDKLSRMPSSTIQILGAEKALFRHLKGEGRAPKYGILFSHPLVQQAGNEKRGKVARIIAAKIFLASKTDFFSKEDRGNALKKELEEDVKKA